MIKVETLRVAGFCASSLLALAACSGTPANPSPETRQPEAVETPHGQPNVPPHPQGQEPRPDASALVEQAVRNARRSLDSRLFEDARNEAAFALELDNQNSEAREILRRCNEVLGD